MQEQLPLNPYEEYSLTGPPEYEEKEEICELCGREIPEYDVFLWRDTVVLCEACYREVEAEGGFYGEV